MKRKFGSTTGRGVHVEQLLTNMALGYTPRMTIGDQLYPTVPVMKQSDYFAIWSRADILRIENDKRSPGKEANMIEQGVSSGQYYCDNYALKYPITIEDRANADPIFVQGLLNGRTKFILDKLALSAEKRIADQVTNTANVGSSSAVSSGWNDLANSDPVTDIWTAIDNVQDSTGIRPNSIVLGEPAWRNLRRNDKLNNQILGNNNGGRNATRQQIANFFEIERFLVGAAYQNTGNEAQSEVIANIWGDSALVYFAPMTAMTGDDPSFGYNFRWNANGIANMQVERHPFDSRTKSEEVEAGYYQDEKITGSDYGFLITATNSST